jgi:hypothetical protein
MDRRELINEIIRISSVDEVELIYDLAFRTEAELKEELSLAKNNLKNEIFEHLGEDISVLINYTSKEITDAENNKLEQLQEELSELITDIKIKYG